VDEFFVVHHILYNSNSANCRGYSSVIGVSFLRMHANVLVKGMIVMMLFG
jgi:hypothetical protein